MDLYSDKIYPTLKCCVCYESFKIDGEDYSKMEPNQEFYVLDEIYKCKICNEGVYCQDCFNKICSYGPQTRYDINHIKLFKYIKSYPCAICKSNLYNVDFNKELQYIFNNIIELNDSKYLWPYDEFAKECCDVLEDGERYKSKPVFKILYNNLNSI